MLAAGVGIIGIGLSSADLRWRYPTIPMTTSAVHPTQATEALARLEISLVICIHFVGSGPGRSFAKT